MTDQPMTEQNPYTAPDAVLDGGHDVHYEPTIFSFSGRIGRLRYLAYSFGLSFLLMVVISFVTAFMGVMGGENSILAMVGLVLVGILYVVVIVLTMGFAKRRFNDLDKSGWWMLTFLIPVVNLLVSIYLIFFPGTDGSNRFGPAPAANTTGVVILGWTIPVLFILGMVAAIAIPQFAGVS